MKRFLIGTAVFFLAINFYAKTTNIAMKIEDILSSIPSHTKYGIMIYNPVTKDTIFTRNISELLKPASNAKLYTTGAAFALLGANYRFATKLLTNDTYLSDGVINGDLYIKGYGNSLMTDKDIDTMVIYLRSIGIHKITGRVIGDDSYFDDMYYRKDWIEDEETHDALPPVSAIVINRNRIQFSLKTSGKTGNKISYNIIPSCSLFKIKLNARTTRGKSKISISQNISSNGYDFVISGNLSRKSRSTWLSAEIKNPPLFAALLLQDRLLKAGISVSQKPAGGEAPYGVHEITRRSIELRYLSKIINKQSDNFLAECLFKTIGAVYSNKQGNSFYSAQAINSFLKKYSIVSAGISVVDGSGLSRYNQVTVGGMVNLLYKIYFDSRLYNDYFNSLAISGVDGTLRHRMLGSMAENNFHGKTGTLNGVIALSGYLTIKGRPDLIVSIVFEFDKGSAYKYRFIADQIVETLSDNRYFAIGNYQTGQR
ncbi:MAG: D-alanyl-D-alanine carboxypeptidase/D-alanyl-D-alanine-endopeptidase [Ignavibacteria bacterium]